MLFWLLFLDGFDGKRYDDMFFNGRDNVEEMCGFVLG